MTSTLGAVSKCTRLMTDPIFLDRIPDPDPFEKLDLIPHSDPLAFSGSAIRSDPTYRSIWVLRDHQCVSYLLTKPIGKTCLTENT
jgi:hypothetical protein